MNLARIRMLKRPYNRIFREAPLQRRLSGAGQDPSSATGASVYGLLAQAFQASDAGSIPIARSINLVDSVALPLLTKTRKWAELGFELWIGDPAEINGKRLKKYENSCGKERGRIRFSSLTLESS